MNTCSKYKSSPLWSLLYGLAADQGLFIQFMFAIVLVLSTVVLQVSVQTLDNDLRTPGSPGPDLQDVQEASIFSGAGQSHRTTALRIFQSNRPRFEPRNMHVARGMDEIMAGSMARRRPQRQAQHMQATVLHETIASSPTGKEAEPHFH
jgi:hypothetical protein